LLEKLNVRVEEIGTKYKNPIEKDSQINSKFKKKKDFKSKKKKFKMKNNKRKKFGRR